MQKSVPDQENCTDIQIWNENGTYNNRAGHKEMSLIDNWMTTDPDFASNMQRAPNLPSTSKADNAAWHEVWNPAPVKQSSDQQKKENRREKNRKSAKESRERVKQEQLKAKEKNEILEKENTQLTDDIERLTIKVRDLEIVKDSIIHQESCKDKSDIVDINEHNSGCTRSMQVQTLEKMKDSRHVEIFPNEKNATSDNMCVTDHGYQQQEQHSIEQEAGTQPGLSSTQGNSFAPSCSYALNSSGTNLQSVSETSQVTIPANQDCNLMYSLNLIITNDQLPLIPGQSISDLSSPISVRNGSDQLCLIPGLNVSDQSSLFPGQNVSDLSSLFPGQNVSDLSSLFPGQNVSDLSSLISVRNGSDQLCLIHRRNISDQSALIPVGNVSDQSPLTPVQVTVNTNTTVFRSQSNIEQHSTFTRPWCVEADQNDDNERQALVKFFLE